MNIPFTTEEFFKIFTQYNTAVFPVQYLLFLLGIIAVYFTFKDSRNSTRIINLILSFFWLWMGVAYHLVFFTAINKAAYLFGSLFIVQGVIFLLWSIGPNAISYNSTGWPRILSAIMIMYALLIY